MGLQGLRFISLIPSFHPSPPLKRKITQKFIKPISSQWFYGMYLFFSEQLVICVLHDLWAGVGEGEETLDVGLTKKEMMGVYAV